MARARRDRLTPEEARALVAQHGSQRAAARAYGVGQSTFWRWLHPDRGREHARRDWRKRSTAPGWHAKEAERQRRFRVDNPRNFEREAERRRERYANDPAYRERVLGHSRFNRLANPPMRINY